MVEVPFFVIISSIFVVAFLFEYVDSALGMGYGGSVFSIAVCRW